MARKNNSQNNMMQKARIPMVGKKGGIAIAAGAALGGIAGAAMGGMAGALFVNRNAREKVTEAVGTASKYATNAAEVLMENTQQQGAFRQSRGRKGGRSSSRQSR